MAACTHAITTASTSNASSYATGAFTPAANDLLVVMVQATGTTTTPGSVSNSLGLTFTAIGDGTYGTSAPHRIYAFVADALAAASSQTCTFDCTGDAATGATVTVYRISGMTRTGSNAVKGSNYGFAPDQAAATTPAVTLATVLTGNPTLCFVGSLTNTASVTPPGSWTEGSDTGYSTPTAGIETCHRDSGFTGTTITWGSTCPTQYAAFAAEFDTSALASAGAIRLPLLGVG